MPGIVRLWPDSGGGNPISAGSEYRACDRCQAAVIGFPALPFFFFGGAAWIGGIGLVCRCAGRP